MDDPCCVRARVFVVGVDGSSVNVAFPSFREDFPGVTNAQLSWVLNSYVLVYAALLVVTGRLADRMGRLRVMSLGLIVFVIASIGVAISPNVVSLGSMRGLQGVGAALITLASMGLVIASWPTGPSTAYEAYQWGFSFIMITSIIGTLLVVRVRPSANSRS